MPPAPPAPSLHLTRRRWIAHSLAVATLLAAAVLILWPPETSTLYPVCPVWRYLHLQCPGCGAARALSALLRGHLAQALHYNPLFVALFPFGLAAAIQTYRRALTYDELRLPHLPRPALYATLAAAFLFAILRNLPASVL